MYLWDCVRKTKQYKSDASGGLACASNLEILNLGKVQQIHLYNATKPWNLFNQVWYREHLCDSSETRDRDSDGARDEYEEPKRVREMFGQGHELSALVCMCTTGQFIQTAMPKVPCAERKHISFPRLSGSPWSKTNTEASFSISTKLYVFVNFWSLWNGIYSRTLCKRTHMYELRTTWKK